MNCPSFINVLDLHRERRLSARRTKAAERHLAACAACRALAAPGAPTAPSALAPETLKTKLLAAAKAGPGAPPAANTRAPVYGLPLWPREARGIALAAAALLIVGLFVAAAGAPSQSAGTVAAAEEP